MNERLSALEKLTKDTTLDLSEVKRNQKVISKRVADNEENFNSEIAKILSKIEAFRNEFEIDKKKV